MAAGTDLLPPLPSVMQRKSHLHRSGLELSTIRRPIVVQHASAARCAAQDGRAGARRSRPSFVRSGTGFGSTLR
jgi:hypothetical protein